MLLHQEEEEKQMEKEVTIETQNEQLMCLDQLETTKQDKTSSSHKHTHKMG